MSTSSLEAVEVALLVLIGVLTPLICIGGLGWAYLMQERDSTKHAHRSSEER
ncbi:hypothetical protein EV651_10410 [Kribbella sp. VKM Ac-2571]|uniref:hypothetical protein n=1 Tax=Kribbella sp. VKM Ac-2571 TaxID=2512222 RepID=UPI0010D144A2|nr:hypothetical protein [Kribbella sp. VKM Ac-2571]TDO66445.1 hypothetical protein EV651_10410 [Kribbella sp. VKM Ac-2571]